MRYDKQNRKLENLHAEIAELKIQNSRLTTEAANVKAILDKDFPDIKVWHGYELLAKLRTAKVVDDALIRAIYEALEANGDMTRTWRDAKYTMFKRVFGSGPKA